MKKSKQKMNDELMKRLKVDLKKIMFLFKEYEQDYADFEEKQRTLPPSEIKAEEFKFYQKHSFPPVHPVFIKILAKRGDEIGWNYDQWRDLLTFRLFSPVHLDETIKPNEQGNPVSFYRQDERGYIYLLINPNFPRKLIHHALDNILDIIRETESATQIKQKRFREELIEALDVWVERRNRKPYPQIAREFNITQSAAKKRFYSSYEFLYKKPYNSAEYEKPEIKKEYLKRVCSTCADKQTCKVLCPDVIQFVEQDGKPYQRERLQKQLDNPAKRGRKLSKKIHS